MIPADSELREPEKRMGDFPEATAFERYAVKTSENIRSLCVPWGLKKSQGRSCIDSRMLSTTVATPCKTLRALQATTG